MVFPNGRTKITVGQSKSTRRHGHLKAIDLRLYVQETQSSHVLRRSCSEMPQAYKWTHVLGLFNPLGKFDSSRSSLPPDVPSGEQQLRAFPASVHSHWRQDALQTQRQMLQCTTRWDVGLLFRRLVKYF